jgi:CPA2 family monovalent cation:H+ antiporter-2
VLAGIAGGLEPRLAPLATGYVLILAISGPVLMRFAEDLVPSRLRQPRAGLATESR